MKICENSAVQAVRDVFSTNVDDNIFLLLGIARCIENYFVIGTIMNCFGAKINMLNNRCNF